MRGLYENLKIRIHRSSLESTLPKPFPTNFADGMGCDVVSKVPFNFCGSSVDQVGTISLWGSKKYLQKSAQRELTGGLGGRDGSDGVSKVSFNFLYNLWVYRSCIYIIIYSQKLSAQISCGSKMLVKLGGFQEKFKVTL